MRSWRVQGGEIVCRLRLSMDAAVQPLWHIDIETKIVSHVCIFFMNRDCIEMSKE